jgi:hypothetical protein
MLASSYGTGATTCTILQIEIDSLESTTPQFSSSFTKLNLLPTFVDYIEGTFKCARLEPCLGKLEKV